jgi:hypothetical protein
MPAHSKKIKYIGAVSMLILGCLQVQAQQAPDSSSAAPPASVAPAPAPASSSTGVPAPAAGGQPASPGGTGEADSSTSSALDYPASQIANEAIDRLSKAILAKESL